MKLPALSQKPDRPQAVPAAHVAAAHAAVEKTSKRVNVDVPEELHRRVKEKASGEGRTIREVVLELLSTYIK